MFESATCFCFDCGQTEDALERGLRPRFQVLDGLSAETPAAGAV